MAKKKAKKKVKRKVKRRRVQKLTPRQQLLQKIANVTERVPYIEPTGECLDPQTQEVLFKFTEAQKVFERYREECWIEKLRYRPYYGPLAPVVIPADRGVFAAFPFCVEDLETGELIAGWGFGGGMNADWSGNTAHTRALKQFLLTFFQATWTDPEQLSKAEQKRQIQEQVRQELEQNGTVAAIKRLEDFWSNQFPKKGATHGKYKPARSAVRTTNRKKRGRKN